MTGQQIIETLATKVMGWIIRDDYRDHLNPRKIYFNEINSKWIRYVENWNPLENLADAWQLVDKIGPFEYRKSPVQNGDYQHDAKFLSWTLRRRRNHTRCDMSSCIKSLRD
nr:hypothetical protein [Brevibacillus laterosporus]